MTITPNGAVDTEVDVLVVGTGTGMAAALSAYEQGLDVLVIEKTEYVGGSTALSGGGVWIPANPVLTNAGSTDTIAQAMAYADSVVAGTSPRERWESAINHGPSAVAMLGRTTPLSLMWSKGYSDYHPENPGGHALGRTVEANPFDASVLGEYRAYLRPTALAAPVPMPITSVDYRWMNLMARMPLKALPRIIKRVVQGVGGMVLGREYLAGGQALAAGMFAGLVQAGVPIWTNSTLTELLVEGERVTGAVIEQAGRSLTVTARKGVVLATGGFDHDLRWRHKFQSERLGQWSLGNPGNTGDGIKAAQNIGADTDLMDQAWWFPAVAPIGGGQPTVLLAERSLPGSFLINQEGRRFINESTDYMTFGQTVLRAEQSGQAIEKMWILFDQEYRDSYVFAAGLFPRMPIPAQWYKEGIAFKGDSPTQLATKMGVDPQVLRKSFAEFNRMAAAGIDSQFGRGNSAYDRYYGDPSVSPNPNLRPLRGSPLYAVQIVLSDLGTCGGIKADGMGRVVDLQGDIIKGLYAIGNTAGNAYGQTYPGAGATIGQGIAVGHAAALHLAGAK